MAAGYELPLLLFGGFRRIVEEVHRRLAEAGHPRVRPVHGFAMQAIGDGASAGEVARALGVSKQAAAKTIDRLGELGYVATQQDPADARRKIVTPTPRGEELLALSARFFDEVEAEWAGEIGDRRLRALRADLERVAGATSRRLDGAGWWG